MRRRAITTSLLVLGLACADGPTREARGLAPGNHERSVAHGGAERSYVLHVPAQVGSRPLPLLLAFHGGGGNARGFQRYAGLDPLAERDGFLVAYPNGSHRFFGERLLSWNAGDCCGFASEAGVDDVGFALAVIEDVARLTPVDRLRVYATGHSNGAMLTYRLAAEASDRIAAIAPVAAAPAIEPCAAGSEVRLWKLSGAGHGWPGAGSVLPERLVGPRTDVIHAADEVWRFLERFSLQAP